MSTASPSPRCSHPRVRRREPERLEIIGPPRDEQLVTTVLARGGSARTTGRRGGSDRRGPSERRGPRRERADRPPREGDGTPAASLERPRQPSTAPPSAPLLAASARRVPSPSRGPRPSASEPVASHRNEVLASLPEEQKPIAEQVLRGGIPGVRQAVDKQNEAAQRVGCARDQGGRRGVDRRAAAPPPAHRRMARQGRRGAGRRRRGVADGSALGRGRSRSSPPGTTPPASWPHQLREALTRRVEQEHAAWLTELAETLAGGRTVRALRLSSRPPKAGSPLPPDLSTRLAEAAGAALTAETAPDRYATVLDALAYSPVRSVVVPQGVPAEPGDALLTAVRKLARAACPRSPPPSGSRPPRVRADHEALAAVPGPFRLPPSCPSPTAGADRARGDRIRARGRARSPVAEAEAEVVLDPPVEPEPAATGSEPEAGPTPPVVAEAEPTPPVVAEAEPTPPVVAEPESSAQPESPTEAEPSAEAEPTPQSASKASSSPGCASTHVARRRPRHAGSNRPGRTRRRPSRAHWPIVGGVTHEHDLVGTEPERVEHRPESLGPAEGVAEQRHLGRPSETGQLGATGLGVLVRADGPPVELRRPARRPRGTAAPGWSS